jgi:hypothetical protein
MRNLTFICIAIAAAVGIAACGNKDTSSTVPVAGTGIVGTCPLGSTLQGSVCVSPNGTVTPPSTGPGGPTTGARFYSENWAARNLNIVGDTYGDFIRDVMGVCGPYTQMSDCSIWVSGAFDIVLLTDNIQANQFTAVVRLKPRGVGSTFAPAVVPLNFTLSVTNNYQGFEARGHGPFLSPANRGLIQIQVATGKLEDAYFDYRIAYDGKIIINGRFQKCSTADCGLSGNIGN